MPGRGGHRGFHRVRGGCDEDPSPPHLDIFTRFLGFSFCSLFFGFEKENNHQISRASDSHDDVLKHGLAARGDANVHEFRPHPAAVRNHARFPRQRTPTRRARRIRFTSCQTARASAHRAVHLDRPDTKARACSWRHANAQALGDDTEQRVYTFGRRSFSTSICSAQVRASLCPRLFTISPANCQSGVTDKTLFAPGDANLNNTVSLRRSAMPNDG